MSRNRTLWPAVPFFMAHDEGGSQDITTAGLFLTWDTIDYQTSHFNYTADDDAVFIAHTFSGMIRIMFEVSANPYGGTAPTYIKLYKNDVAVDGAYSYFTPIYDNQSSFGEHVSLTFADYFEKDDKIQIYGDAIANTCRTIAHTSRLILEFLPFRGWNNNHGGRWQYTGRVLR